jgi:hypothetical protein
MVFHPGDHRQLHHIPPELRLPAPRRSRAYLVDFRWGVGPDQRTLRSGKQTDAKPAHQSRRTCAVREMTTCGILDT